MEVDLIYKKWPAQPHWEMRTTLLGSDGHGTWLGRPAGATADRPGLHLVNRTANVVLIPEHHAWIASFNADEPEIREFCEIYVDMCTVPTWNEARDTVTAVDLDLDVIRRWNGAVEVLDEDEFADHQVRYGYPAELITLAEQTRETVAAQVRAATEPFGTVARHWLEQVGPG